MYGYGNGYYEDAYAVYSGISNFMGAIGILSLIAFIAAIVFTVIFYKKYAKGSEAERISFKDQVQIGRFLRFDTLLIDKILKAMYLFTALFTAFETLAFVLASFALGFLAFVGALLFGVVSVAVGEILIRTGFEDAMLRVIIARNTTLMRNQMTGERTDSDGIASGTYAPQIPKGNHVPASNPNEVVCPHCGATNSAGSKFCFKCGKGLQ